jgi:hypothetical protein
VTSFYFIENISGKNAYKIMILVTPLPILVTPLPKSFGNVSARPPFAAQTDFTRSAEFNRAELAVII